MTTTGRVLLADDDELSRDFLGEALRTFGWDVREAADGNEALAALDGGAFDLVLTDLRMPGADGLEVLAESRQREPDRPVVLITAHGTMHVATDAMRRGAADVLEKPVAVDELEVALERVGERTRLQRENSFLRAEAIGGDLVVASGEMRELVATVQRIAASKATVLVHGESGTGKERIAALVHRSSDRSHRPFIKLNCAAIPESLLESELFGHEAGAFTGAGKRREGRFELADGGTLFLDEVGEMSASMQAKLLRVLQEGEFERVGSGRTQTVDVRVVAATNRDLAEEVSAGRFRADLLYRLNVLPVVLPPLRERRDDILPLARHFLREGLSLEPDAERVLLNWSWPGNVRELQNLVERVGLMSNGPTVDAALVTEWLGPGGGGTERTVVLQPADAYVQLVGTPLADIERNVIRKTLEHCDGNRTRTAQLLGIGVRTLFNKLKEEELTTNGESRTA